MTENKFSVITKDGMIDAPTAGGCVIALGSFDGVHSAHRRLIKEAIALKERIGCAAVGAWCFADLPANSFCEEKTPLLCTVEERIKCLLSIGLDFVAVADFKSFRSLSAVDFIEDILKKRLGCVGAACGFNHRFGNCGLGTPALLKSVFGEDSAYVLPEVTLCGKTVSSSAIRSYILDGDMDLVRLMLDRPFSLTSKVVEGKKLGRKLGFPTANQFFPKGGIVPKYGIYATLCQVDDGKPYIGVSNVGIRPTIADGTDSHIANCETYIHGFDGDIYGKTVSVSFYKYLRAEKRFSSLEELSEQINNDLQNSIDHFGGGVDVPHNEY